MKFDPKVSTNKNYRKFCLNSETNTKGKHAQRKRSLTLLIESFQQNQKRSKQEVCLTGNQCKTAFDDHVVKVQGNVVVVLFNAF